MSLHSCKPLKVHSAKVFRFQNLEVLVLRQCQHVAEKNLNMALIRYSITQAVYVSFNFLGFVRDVT